MAPRTVRREDKRLLRCVVRPEQIHRGVVALDARQTKHVVTVLRLRAGDELVVVPGAQAPQVARLEVVRGSRVTARVVGPAPAPPAERWRITLAAAVPRHPAAFDQMIDQATQIGAAAIIPMTTARSVARPASAPGDARHRRWEHLAAAAAEQSGRAAVPRIAPVTPLAEVLASAAAYDRILLPTVGATSASVADWLHSPIPQRLLVLIGPEGDFTPEEVAEAARQEALPISLGYQVLRCETAALVVLTVLVQTLRNLPQNISAPA